MIADKHFAKLADEICALTAEIGNANALKRTELEWLRSHGKFVTTKDLKAMEERIMDVLTTLEAEVKKNTEVQQSAITLLNGLAAKIEAVKSDPVKLQALANELRTSSAQLSEAIVANTPAEENPPAPEGRPRGR